jgi:hypothetical protein
MGVPDGPAPRAGATHTHTHTQEEAGVARDSVTVRKEAAYWTQRFRLKNAVEGEGGELDVPCFLRPHINEILVTGVRGEGCRLSAGRWWAWSHLVQPAHA